MPNALAMLEVAPGPVSSTLPFLFSLALGGNLLPHSRGKKSELHPH